MGDLVVLPMAASWRVVNTLCLMWLLLAGVIFVLQGCSGDASDDLHGGIQTGHPDGNHTWDHDGSHNGHHDGDHTGDHGGNHTGHHDGNHTGHPDGNHTGDHDGSYTGHGGSERGVPKMLQA